MARICAICGKRADVGNTVSHSKQHTKRRRLPNLQRVHANIDGKSSQIDVCVQCIRSGRIQKSVR
ncbi:50S ribosomal protein L28 [Candidatus Acetothermia bacterium]|nr:50S ribosomal protein L28 [Candidatus Acetothermia bacterium]